jgi:uncharacterized protein (TIGR02231 family)
MEFVCPFALIEKTINICRMNRFLITVAASALALACQAQSNRTYASRVKRATVYLQGAQLYYSEDVSLPAGTSELVFEGISPQLDQSTLFSSGRGNFMILETRFDAKYPEEVKPKAKLGGKYQKQMEAVSDSLFELGLDQQSINDRRAALLIEKNTLLNNRLIKGELKRDTLAVLKDAMDYLRQRLNNINTEQLKLTRDENRLRKLQARLQERLSELGRLQSAVEGGGEQPQAEPVYQVVLTVSADAPVNGTVLFNYYVPNASWTPNYELKGGTGASTIQIVQKAQIEQQTNIDWNNCLLTLSTGNPRLSNVRPNLSAWYLNFYAPSYPRPKALQRRAKGTSDMVPQTLIMEQEASKAYSDELKEIPIAGSTSNQARNASVITEITENAINVEYEIAVPYKIPSDGKPHQVVIQRKDIGAQLEYSSVPKLDRDAFLQARITGWEDLNLLPGEAKIYFDGAFVGSSMVSPVNATDTLVLDMGRDKSIVVQRTRNNLKQKEKLFSDYKVQTVSYTLSVRNTKATAIDVRLQDQVPLVNSAEIEVKVLEISDGRKNDETGVVDWILNVKPKETKTVKLVYEVKYPKNKVIGNIN